MCNLCSVVTCHGVTELPVHVFTPPLTTSYCLHPGPGTGHWRPPRPAHTDPEHGAHRAILRPQLRDHVSKILINQIMVSIFIKIRQLEDDYEYFKTLKNNNKVNNIIRKNYLSSECSTSKLGDSTDAKPTIYNLYTIHTFIQFRLCLRVYLPVSGCGKWPGPGWEPD